MDRQSCFLACTNRPGTARRYQVLNSAVKQTLTLLSRTSKEHRTSASRASDVFARSSSRAGRSFDVGDNVRIESLGFEGTLKFLGEIEGKSGLFAGVELGPGFAGKGKNDGSVNG